MIILMYTHEVNNITETVTPKLNKNSRERKMYGKFEVQIIHIYLEHLSLCKQVQE